MSKAISEVFDVNPVPPNSLPTIIQEPKDLEKDGALVRGNIKSMIELSKTALENAAHLAVQSESPRAYEVFANLLNTVGDLNMKLLDSHEKETKVKAVSTKNDDAKNLTQNNTTNNVIFAGTPNELAKLLKGDSNETK